jgi:PAS domain S-box-containing protein
VNDPQDDPSLVARLEAENRALRAQLDDLRLRLHEPEELVRAIRGGEVDSFVVSEPNGERIYSLRTADLLYRAMIEQMQDGAVAVDASGVIVFCNAYFAGLMKAERASIVGTGISRFAPLESRSFFDALTRESGDAERRSQLVLRASDGELVPVLAAMNRIDVEDNQVFCLVVTSLADEKRKEELLAESRRKDEFLAMLAHELRNPLAPIRYAAESLRASDLDTARVAWARDVISRQVTQLTHLVDDLLDVSRITRGMVVLQREPLELRGVVARSVEGMLPLIEARRQKLIVRQPPEPLSALADNTRLVQIVSNLLNNASKFTPEGGRIWLIVERHNEWVHLIVRDTGVGIAHHLLPEIFNLFTQADRSPGRSQGGLGIGLTLVRNLVELHGGTVEGSSEGPDRGSEFVVRLPLLIDSKQEAADPGGSAATPTRVRRRRILVVDDNPEVADSFAYLLASWGQEVRTVSSGETALTEASTFRPQIMFIDIGLPGLSGHETAKKLRGMPELEGVILIAVTGYGQNEDRRRSLEAGFDQHWVKPFRPELLTDLLGEVRGPRGSAGTADPPSATSDVRGPT